MANDPAELAPSDQHRWERLYERMRRLLSGSPTVIYAFENPGDWTACTFVSDNAGQVVGYPAREMLADPDFWRNHLHPDDRERVLASLDGLLASGAIEIEYRFLKASGEYAWIRDLAKVIQNAAGEAEAIVGSWADITAAKRLEQELQRLRMAVEASVDMVLLTDADGLIEYANPSFTRTTGWAFDEVAGRNTRILQGGKMPAEVAEAMWQTLKRGESWRGRLLNRRKGPPAFPVAGRADPPDPLRYWAEASITPIRDDRGGTLGYVSIQRDISALVAEEERLAMEREDGAARLRIADILSRPEPLESRCAAVLDNLLGLRGLGLQPKGGVFLRDPKSDGLDMLALRGAFSDEFAQRERRIPLGACLCGRAAASGELLVSDDCRCDPRHERRPGDMARHGHYIVPLAGNGEVFGVLLLYTDPHPSRDPARLGTLRQVGEMLGLAVLQARAAEALREARDAAFESSRLKSEFLANMSHEIRTPMNGVLGMLDLLRSTPLTAEQREFTETAHHSAEALLNIINDILDFSKIEAGKLELESIDFDLCQLVEEVCALLAGRAHAKGLEFNCFVVPGLPGRLRGDPTRLRQVLTNLLGNAVKFTERGEVSVDVLCVSEDDRRATVRFNIRDTGIGIDREAQARLFRPFSQADGATTRRFGGTGLGLSISKELAERMGGEIGVESAPGEGATFWFTAALEKQPAGQARPDACHLAGRRVLVVDDNATNRRILDCFLGNWGAEPELTEHAPAALAKLRAAQAQGHPYDLAILDFQMPGMDGLALSRAMAEDPALRAVPRLLLSSGGSIDENERRTTGIARVLNKPVRQSYLYDAIAAILFEASPPVSAAPPEECPLPSYAGRRILLVEDHAINQKVALKMLGRFGLEPVLAADGREALAALERDRYDLVLMDCQMPNLDGYEATRAWRAREREQSRPRTPIAALTANAMQADRDTCLAAGMDDHLAKPFTTDTLAALLARWLAGAPPPAAPPPEPSAPLWDSGKALRQMGGDRELLEELLRLFVEEEAPRELERLARATARREAPAIADSAHALKGMGGHFFAAEMMARAARLEREARGGNLAQADSLAAGLEAETRRLCAQMAMDLRSLSEGPSPHTQGDGPWQASTR